MIFYDFEVFKKDWLGVFIDVTKKQEYVIINSPEELEALYEANKYDIWVGFNSRHYDQYILKAILCGLNPKELNDWIIVQKREPWQFSRLLNSVPLNNFDVMPNPPIGLKTLEGFLGSNIKETEVPFNIDRKLTEKEIEQTVFYCRHDVEQTIEVFIQRKAEFEAQYGVVKAFNLPLNMIGYTEARITAQVLGCVKKDFDDEFDYFFLPCIQLKKYSIVMDWFLQKRDEIKAKIADYRGDTYWVKREFYKQSFELTVAGIPHTFGFGGLHGATAKPIHATGLILHVDVGSYYPSMLIAWDLVTRAATNDNYKLVYDTRMQLKAEGKKKEQAPYKKLLNALSGAMKDETNPAYDPRNNNCMCINGQLMLLDLIEHLEVVPGFQLLQSNTDGLIIRISDTDEAFDMVDDICWDWEQRCSTAKCSITLGLDTIAEIYQKDVNNYLWIDAEGKVERKGAYVKELSQIDNDLPILNEALVEYMVHKTPVEKTIGDCTELIKFQKLVKLSENYKWVEHEHGGRVLKQSGVRKIKQWYEYTKTKRYSYKSYRVFASKDPDDGRILRCGGARGRAEKFGNTPDHCFIFNDSVVGVKVPDNLDKSWYIDLAKKRLKDFGIMA
nr:MAG TPA: DNA polymerase [Caudoviricetes sp.]